MHNGDEIKKHYWNDFNVRVLQLLFLTENVLKSDLNHVCVVLP